MKRLTITMIAALCAPGLALGGATDWQEVAPDTRIRLISSDRVENGLTWAALEVEMPQSTKTYWRVPGETGIPTKLDMSASSGIAEAEIHWPVPQRDTKDGYLDYVYYGSLVLPIAVQVEGDKGQLEAEVLMGVCDEICVPVKAQFSLPLSFEKADAGQDFRIRQALSSVPQGWPDTMPPVTSLSIDKVQGAVIARVSAAGIETPSILLDNGNPVLIFAEAEAGPETDSYLIRPIGKLDWDNLAGTEFTLTYRTAKGLFQQQLRLDE